MGFFKKYFIAFALAFFFTDCYLRLIDVLSESVSFIGAALTILAVVVYVLNVDFYED